MATSYEWQWQTRGARSAARCILVVDENPLVGHVVVQGLAALGHRAIHCASADEALRLCAHGLADGALIEAGLRTSDGVSLVALLYDRFPHVPVAVLTAWSDHPETRCADGRGVRMVLRKPIRLEQLDLAVRTLYDIAPLPERCPN